MDRIARHNAIRDVLYTSVCVCVRVCVCVCVCVSDCPLCALIQFMCLITGPSSLSGSRVQTLRMMLWSLEN